ncbi:MAG: TRAP transporter permease DctQ, partial [Deltaproteobacteria bacterium CG_4_8_14_3_um_filter_51_11]
MERAIRLINRLSIGLGLLVAPLTAIITALVFYEVICRYFLNAATSWTAEVENYLQVTLVMLGGAYCLSHGSHVRV